MSNTLKQYCKYMEKKANPFDNLWVGLTTGKELTGDAIAAALALSALAGGFGGYGASKITSPGKRDFQNAQREFLTETLDEKVAKRRRELALAEKKEKQEAFAPPPKQRSIRL